MKKLTVVLFLVLALALVCSGCKKEEAPKEPAFVMNTTETGIQITANEASKGTGGVGFLTFGENQYLNYTTSGDDGSQALHVMIFEADPDADPADFPVPDLDDQNWVMDFTVQNNASNLVAMDPGYYAFLIEADSEPYSGTATFEAVDDL
ncbi:MAG: hypothetical protein IKR43_07345 [Lachnospiraceae bacterium]|nr:hypothetical protein [Lachnospiraceae bacterium]